MVAQSKPEVAPLIVKDRMGRLVKLTRGSIRIPSSHMLSWTRQHGSGPIDDTHPLHHHSNIFKMHNVSVYEDGGGTTVSPVKPEESAETLRADHAMETSFKNWFKSEDTLLKGMHLS